MSNSKLVNYTKISPHKSSPRNNTVNKISIHHMAGNLSVETCGNVFQTREASANYGIGTDGRVGMYVEEKDRAWTSSNRDNDNQAVTIEVANDTLAPSWTVSATAYTKLIELCVDICKRNEIKELTWTGDTRGNLTTHDMFTNTLCPGPYLRPKMPEIAKLVNELLGKEEPVPTPDPTLTPSEQLYKVQVGAYEKKSGAESIAAMLEKQGYETYTVFVKGLYKVQTGAFKDSEKADNLLIELRDKGFDCFITTEDGEAVPTEPTKSINEVAKEVIAGKWGNGSERKEKLENAGYNSDEVQAEVNRLMR